MKPLNFPDTDVKTFLRRLKSGSKIDGLSGRNKIREWTWTPRRFLLHPQVLPVISAPASPIITPTPPIQPIRPQCCTLLRTMSHTRTPSCPVPRRTSTISIMPTPAPETKLLHAHFKQGVCVCMYKCYTNRQTRHGRNYVRRLNHPLDKIKVRNIRFSSKVRFTMVVPYLNRWVLTDWGTNNSNASPTGSYNLKSDSRCMYIGICIDSTR